MDLKATSAFTLSKELDMPKETVYRALRLLLSKGLIVKARPIKLSGNRSITIYALNGYTPDDIKNAYTRDQRLRTPGYRLMERVVQTLMDDFPTTHNTSESEIHVYLAEVDAVLKQESTGFRWWELKDEARYTYIQTLKAVYPNKKLVIHAGGTPRI